MPAVVKTPPISVVFWRPSLSTKMPEIGLNRKVAPIVSDPTRAKDEKQRN